jgi:hypothetical protein
LRIQVEKPGRSCSASQIDMARYSCDARNSKRQMLVGPLEQFEAIGDRPG